MRRSVRIYEELYYKMTITKKIKTFDNKIEQDNAQYNFDRQTAKTSALLSGNVSRYEFLSKTFYQNKVC